MQTRKYPRTMEQAFGPYARGPIEEPKQPWHWQDKVVLAGCAVTFIGWVLVVVLA